MKVQVSWQQVKENKYLHDVAQDLINRKNRSSIALAKAKVEEGEWTLHWTEQLSVCKDESKFKNITLYLRLSFGNSWWDSHPLTSLPESVLAFIAKEIE